MKQTVKKVVRWIKSHPRRALAYSGLVVITATAGIATYVALNQKLPRFNLVPIKVDKPKPKLIYSFMTGLPVASKEDQTKPVTAIMLENSPDSRPQSGLKQAEVVYEAIAEGGITRFIAIYQQNKPGLIGPVRSLRPYYLAWATPYDASMAHIGGSATALDEVRNGNYRDIDQFFNAGAYWRSSDRYPPHNVYTDFAHLDALNASKGYVTSNPKPLLREDEKPSKSPTATKIDIDISGPTYASAWQYNASTNDYSRFEGGEPHTDREEGQIRDKVVIVLHVEEGIAADGYRQEIVTSGTGKATIFQNGEVIEGIWTKPSPVDQISFKDSVGKDFALARGQTWVTAIPGNGSVSWQK